METYCKIKHWIFSDPFADTISLFLCHGSHYTIALAFGFLQPCKFASQLLNCSDEVAPCWPCPSCCHHANLALISLQCISDSFSSSLQNLNGSVNMKGIFLSADSKVKCNFYKTENICIFDLNTWFWRVSVSDTLSVTCECQTMF